MQKQKGFNGNTLKIIALVSMLIDHIGFVIIEKLIDITAVSHVSSLEIIDLIFRMIGRLAFPIFCFLLVEGFIYTKNLKKYIKRIAIFAIVSEMPFNIIYGKLFYIEHQNIFFTLFTGLIAMSILQKIKKLDNIFLKIIFSIMTIGILSFLAELFRFDYGYAGVICICIIYLLRNYRVLSIIASSIILVLFNPLELSVFLDAILIQSYNGKRGNGGKWFFYIFYPVHLVLLSIIAYILNFLMVS